jgi:hypothetical protein
MFLKKFTDVPLLILYVVTCTDTPSIVVFNLNGSITEHNTLLHKINPYTVTGLDHKIDQSCNISVQG